LRRLILLSVFVAGCSTRPVESVEATWSEATVIAFDFSKPVPLHTPFPTVYVKATITNATDGRAEFYRGGYNFGDGSVEGAEPDAPGRFLLVTPDTTVSFYVRRGGFAPDLLTVGPGASAEVRLVADSWWLSSPDGRRPTFVEWDSASVADFYLDALEHGHIVYEDGSGSPLPVVRARDAVAVVRSPLAWM
jgi:hypothetical protein